jgi:hypothetical protein
MTPEGLDGISRREVAAYVRDVAEQLAAMAREMRLDGLASALDLAVRAAKQSLQENAAPDDAA